MRLSRMLPAVAAISMSVCFSAGCNVDPVWPAGRQVHEPIARDAAAAESVDLAVIEPQEVDLVEAVLTHRRTYHESLEALRDYYRDKGYATKESWAAFELQGARATKQFRYVLDSEVPSSALRAEESVPDADALYDEAHALMREGGHGVPGFYRRKLMVEAAGTFRELIETYPRSDKIDDAAFFLGEIHAEYLPNQAALAVAWYERAWQWDPNTPHPAKLRAARVYDFQLNARGKALELYQQVLAEDSNLGRMDRFSASRRVEQLSRSDRTVQVSLPEPE